jgi:GTP-binding protein
MARAEKIRNVAIVAHIDHGKTTLIDSIFRCAHVFRDNQHMPERVMDNNELERERGITIRSKHCTVEWNGYLINIIDTPGHADFSGEVERVLSMVDSVLLLVDANEGPKPQTRYVLMRALKFGLRPIVIINKVDRPNADPEGALNKTFDLFLELGASEKQGDFSVLYGSGLNGWLVRDLEHDAHEGMTALFETIVENVPPPSVDEDGPFLMQISTLAWSDYLGQIGCGRVLRGHLTKGDSFQRTVTRWREAGDKKAGWDVVGTRVEKAVHMWETRGLQREEVDEISAGDILWIAGPEEINIGDTFSALDSPDAALPPLEIEEPTVSMFFHNNSGPFAGDDGKAVSLGVIRERLRRELRTNVALRVEESDRFTGIKVSGRGELHLGILIEEMRREGMELCVSRPEVILHKDKHGKTLEPMEQVVIDVPTEYQGIVIEKLSQRKGELSHMEPLGPGVVRITADAPTRGLIGYRSGFLTDTRGLGIMVSRFIGYGPWRGEVLGRSRGSLVSMETGIATAYQIEKLQERTVLFVEPNDRVYTGQIVGENSRQTDLPCNPTKRKELTNHRASNKQMDTGILSAARKMTLDQALEWIADDEFVEVTPKAVRVRKIILNELERRRAQTRGQLVEAAR